VEDRLAVENRLAAEEHLATAHNLTKLKRVIWWGLLFCLWDMDVFSLRCVLVAFLSV
jgi:hypothetical protein